MKTMNVAVIIFVLLSSESHPKRYPRLDPCELIAVSSDFNTVVAAGRGLPKMQAWELHPRRRLWPADDRRLRSVSALASDSSKYFIVTGSFTAGLEVWDGKTGQHRQSVQIENAPTGVRALDLHEETRRIAIVTETARLYVVSLDGSDPV